MAEADLCEGRAIMNEETIDYRLTQIEKKLDTVTDLLLQTQAQEMRLSALEKQNLDLKDEIKNIKTQKSKNIDRWLNPLISTVVSIIVAFIAIKIGLK
jgi:hypothetical protein